MDKNLLLPHVCKRIGAILLATVLLLGFLAAVQSYFIVKPAGNILPMAIIIAAISLPITALSRERVEDEYISSLRGRTLVAVIYVFFIAGLLSIGFRVFGIRVLSLSEFCKIQNWAYYIFNPLTICAVYVLTFNLRLWWLRHNMPETDEVV